MSSSRRAPTTSPSGWSTSRRSPAGCDLGEAFDFLIWFEYAPQDAPAFEDLVSRLRATPEWDYVEREIDVRLAR